MHTSPFVNKIGLVIQRNEVDLDLIQDVLEYEGLTITTANSVKEGCSKLEGMTHLDFLIFNLRLPDGSGYELVQPTRQKFPGIITIAVTAANQEEIPEEGVDMIIRKPFQIAQFVKVIKNLLEGVK